MTITREQVEAMACRLADETDLCRNDEADDIAVLLDEARSLMLDLWTQVDGDCAYPKRPV